LEVGGLAIPNRVFLAPMAGVTDLPFRRLVAGHGAGLTVSEMVAGEWLANGHEGTLAKVERDEAGIHVVQLVGRDAAAMAEGVRHAEDAGADIIDINMGCPARKVTGGYGGAALMRDPDLALRLVEATVAAARVPVTLKMRLGWDETSINAPEIAKRAVEAGVAMIAVHGRTRNQFYGGSADWSAIAAVKDAVAVPVVANGDLVDATDAPRMLALSGADAVMIGRGSIGRPWFPGMVARHLETGVVEAEPEGSALIEELAGLLEAMLSHWGHEHGIRLARKHLAAAMKRLEGEARAELGERRRAVLTGTCPDAVIRELGAFVEAAGSIRRAA